VTAYVSHKQYSLLLDCIIPSQTTFVMDHRITIALPIVISSRENSASTHSASNRLLSVFVVFLVKVALIDLLQG
jgi:hypothetical protein